MDTTAMLPCPACGHKISTLVSKCPSCNRPVSMEDIRFETGYDYHTVTVSTTWKPDDFSKGRDEAIAKMNGAGWELIACHAKWPEDLVGPVINKLLFRRTSGISTSPPPISDMTTAGGCLTLTVALLLVVCLWCALSALT